MRVETDVVIIGSGVIGCSTAYHLAQVGYKVIVLDKNSSIGDGGSTRNGGGVRQSGRHSAELPLAMYGVRELWPELSKKLDVDTEYCQMGNLRLGKTNEDMTVLESIVTRSRLSGLTIDLITGDEARKINPYLSKEIIGASWCLTDGHANPLKVTLGYYMKARALGVRFVTGEEVLSIEQEGGRVKYVNTRNNHYSCDQVLIAAGYGSKALLKPLDINFPMDQIFLDVLVTEKTTPMFEQMLGTAGADFYGHQAKNGSFVFGSSAGITNNTLNDSSEDIGMAATCEGVVAYLPQFKEIKVLRSWTGHIDVTEDHIPVIGPVNQLPGLSVACGFTGHGFGIAPIVGMLLGEMISGKVSTMDLSAFQLNRFQ